MAAYKNHHYVPQFYMRLFSGAAAERVGVYIIAKERFIAEAPIKGQACRDYFYGTDGQAEETLGVIENVTAPILKAIANGRLPPPQSPAYQALMLHLALQHSRTPEAEAQLAESSEQTVRAMLRTKFELEGNESMLAGLERIRIKRTNAIGDAIVAGAVGAMLLADLALLLVKNDSDVPFVASDAPVVAHNRMFESTRSVGVAGYDNVGLQLVLPLGPDRLLLCYDPAAYKPIGAEGGAVSFTQSATARLLNDLQWEAAGKVMLTSPAMDATELHTAAARWRSDRVGPRIIFRQEIVSQTGEEVRVRQGVGPRPSGIALDLPFLEQMLPPPLPLGPYDVAPSRDPMRGAMVRQAWEDIGDLAERSRPLDKR